VRKHPCTVRTESGVVTNVVTAHSQALYGYAGAGAHVLTHLEREMGIDKTFQLTCSWRLPSLHVAQAVAFMRKHGREEFELFEQPRALPGLIAYNSNFTRYPPSETGHHAVLCRTNKELIQLRKELAKRNIASHMAGRRDLAKGLLKLLLQLTPVSPDIATAGCEWESLVVALRCVINAESEDAGVESGVESEDEGDDQGHQGQDSSGEHKDATEVRERCPPQQLVGAASITLR
jgi:hypothetical protein